jgi:hypothetical protein
MMTWEEAKSRLHYFEEGPPQQSDALKTLIAAMAYSQEFEGRLPPPNDVYRLSNGVVVFEWHRDDGTIRRVFIDARKAEQMTTTISGVTKFELLKGVHDGNS